MAGEKVKIKRAGPAMMPTGFRGAISDDVFIVDLLSNYQDDDEVDIFATVVLTKKLAISLRKSLDKFLETESDQ